MLIDFIGIHMYRWIEVNRDDRPSNHINFAIAIPARIAKITAKTTAQIPSVFSH